MIAILWPFIWKYGLGATLLGLMIALYLFTAFKKVAIHVAAGVVLLLLGYTYGAIDGTSTERAKWQAAERRTESVGNRAREESEREIAPLPRVPLPPAKPCRVYDANDRDCR